jgi:DNA-binding NtrC family response regulator
MRGRRVIRRPHLDPAADAGTFDPFSSVRRDGLCQEKSLIAAALHETVGRIAGTNGAAAKLRIPRTTLEAKIKWLEINKHQFKQRAGYVR